LRLLLNKPVIIKRKIKRFSLFKHLSIDNYLERVFLFLYPTWRKAVELPGPQLVPRLDSEDTR